MRGVDAFDVEFISENYWFPIEESESSDLRCLGILLSEEVESFFAESDAVRFAAAQEIDVLSVGEQRRLHSYGTRVALPRLVSNGGLSVTVRSWRIDGRDYAASRFA